jgi:hypothetical protein
VLAPPAVALITLVVALIATDAADIRFRDPDNVAAGYVALVGAAVALLVGLDIAIRAARATGTRRPSRAAMREVRQARWTRERILAAAGALLSFYVSYLAYRNLKAVLPFLRPASSSTASSPSWTGTCSPVTIPPRCCTPCSASGCPRTSSRRSTRRSSCSCRCRSRSRWSSRPTCRRASSSPPRCP